MDHIWIQTRDAAVARLAGLTVDVGSDSYSPDVETNRTNDPEPASCPMFNVYWGDEEITAATRDDTERAFVLHIECWFAGRPIDDGLAAMADVAAAAIEADHNLGGVVARCQYSGAETRKSGDGEKPAGTVRLNYLCTVITAHGNHGLRA